MERFSDQELLYAYIRFTELLVISVKWKKSSIEGINTTNQQLPVWFQETHGVCSNFLARWYSSRLLSFLFAKCSSSNPEKTVFPVRFVGGVGYFTSTPEQKWGNHKYAENRRQLLTECISLVQTELKNRGHNV